MHAACAEGRGGNLRRFVSRGEVDMMGELSSPVRERLRFLTCSGLRSLEIRSGVLGPLVTWSDWGGTTARASVSPRNCACPVDPMAKDGAKCPRLALVSIHEEKEVKQ